MGVTARATASIIQVPTHQSCIPDPERFPTVDQVDFTHPFQAPDNRLIGWSWGQLPDQFSLILGRASLNPK